MPQDVLATDLDGTLIPLDEHPENISDLAKLAELITERAATLVFVTGRHFSSVLNAISENDLPTPDWILCDVGTSIYQRTKSGNQNHSVDFVLADGYVQHQRKILGVFDHETLRTRIPPLPSLQLQESEKQGPFKLSYYADASRLMDLVAELQLLIQKWNAPWSIISSIDPFNGDGLVDFLPATVSKAHALDWWATHTNIPQESIVFAGDSGNDHAALTAGYKSIIVGNAERKLADSVAATHQDEGWHNRLFLAHRAATSGVLDGCQNYWLSK